MSIDELGRLAKEVEHLLELCLGELRETLAPVARKGPVQAADQLPAAGRQRDPDLAPVDRVALPLHITLPLEPVEQRRRCGTREPSGLRQLACGHPRLAQPVKAPEIRRVQAEPPPDFVVEAVCRPLVGLGGPADGSDELLTPARHWHILRYTRDI